MTFLCALLAAVLHVGPSASFKSPSDAARVARDGDTVCIAAGTYRGDVCAWAANDLTIRGAGKELTVLQADGRICRGKAIWVVSGTNVTVAGVSFSGARCPDRNGAGLRFEGDGDLAVRDCSFADNENGILTGALPAATVTIERCVFRENGAGDGFSHNLYIGAVKKLVFRASSSDHARRGHALKSRAHETVIEDSVFDDGTDGVSSYLVNCPNGGRVTMRNSRLRQSAAAVNGTMVAIGEEGPYPGTTFTEEGNRYTDDRPGGVRLRLRQ